MEWAEQEGKGEEKGQAGDGVGWGWGSGTSKGLLGAGGGGREGGWGMRMLRRAPGWGLVSRKPQQAPSGWGEGAVHGTEPAPSFLKSGVLHHCHPLLQDSELGGRRCALRGRGRGPGCDPGPDRGGDHRRPRWRVRGSGRAAGSGGAGGGARRAGPRGQTGTRTDRLMASRAPHHHGRGSLLRPWRLSSPRS